MDKNIVYYCEAYFARDAGPVGNTLWVIAAPNLNIHSTSPVVAYDETMGIFETANTVYVPA